MAERSASYDDESVLWRMIQAAGELEFALDLRGQGPCRDPERMTAFLGELREREREAMAGSEGAQRLKDLSRHIAAVKEVLAVKPGGEEGNGNG